jgi:hypothetical protein
MTHRFDVADVRLRFLNRDKSPLNAPDVPFGDVRAYTLALGGGHEVVGSSNPIVDHPTGTAGIKRLARRNGFEDRARTIKSGVTHWRQQNKRMGQKKTARRA